LIASLLLIVGCSRQPAPQPEIGETVELELSTERPAPGSPPVPTLYPTETIFPPPPPTETRPPSPAEPTSTPIDFSQISVEMRYEIPSLELSRHLVGNVSNQIVLTDETTGYSRTLSDQTGVLIQLQQALPRFELEDLPAGCQECVWLEYDVPLVGESDAGWLRNTQLLASVENYTAVVLGPHFPPNTVAGLRRSATPYQVAHSVAITADEELWGWTAIDSEVPDARAATEGASLTQFLEIVDFDSLPDRLNADCPQGAAFETLFLRAGEEEKLIRITCPEFSLPASLLPVYLQLDDAAEKILEGIGIPHPEPTIPLDSLLFFQREDGARLNLLDGELAVASDVDGSVFTSTLTSTLGITLTNMLALPFTSTITVTDSLSITSTIAITDSPPITSTIGVSIVERLVDSGVLQPGLEAFLTREAGNVLVARAADGLYETVWDELAPLEIRGLVKLLEDLLDALLVRAAAEQEAVPVPTPTVESTAEPPS
jgi:hypothetical protein